VAPFTAEREDEQLLRDGVLVVRDDVSRLAAVVQLLVDALHVVGDRRHLLHVGEGPQFGLKAVHPLERVGRVQRIGRPLEHDLEAVDAREVLVDHPGRLADRVAVGEEVDVVGVHPAA
jgi:hypothetical protein